ASFSTSIDSISPGFISAKGEVTLPAKLMFCNEVLFRKTPSTIYKGSLLELIDVVPLTRKKIASPGTPELVNTCTLGALPCNWASKLAIGILLTSEALTFAIEPVRSCLLWVPYPTTTTSSNDLSAGVNSITVGDVFIITCLFSYPH